MLSPSEVKGEHVVTSAASCHLVTKQDAGSEEEARTERGRAERTRETDLWSCPHCAHICYTSPFEMGFQLFKLKIPAIFMLIKDQDS